MSLTETELLMQLVRARHACLTRIRDIGRRQMEFIDRGEITSLLDALAAKQRPLTDIQRIERALDPFRSQDPEKRVWRSPADRAACAGLVAECESLLREVLIQEKRCEAVLTERRAETASRIESVQTAGRSLGAYAAESRVRASQIDLSSGE